MILLRDDFFFELVIGPNASCIISKYKYSLYNAY